jgi:hypothetical protein
MAVGEWDQRQLCSDGGCVGVIGPAGTCKVCGRAAQNWGDERTRGLNVSPDEEVEDEDDDDLEDEGEDDGDDGDDEDEGDDTDDGDDEDESDDKALDAPAAPGPEVGASAPPAEWGSRQLCPDGSCIGVIGASGTCKVCGRAASRAAPDEPAASRAAPDEPAASAATDTPGASTEAPADIPADAPADAPGPASEPASTDKSGDAS